MSKEPAAFSVVTGAFGYTGKYITQRLLARGERVRTLTGHPNRPDPFGGKVEVAPMDFSNPAQLRASLQGAGTLYNTYWVRFNHGQTTYDRAVANLKTLIQAASDAGVRRILDISIANPSKDSPLPYYRGKAEVEEFILASGLSHAILRPIVVFGTEDILINNIAWLLRRWSVFGIPGKGDYGIQPVFVEDLADLAVNAGATRENIVMDAVGPEVYAFDELVRLIAATVRSRARIVHLPPRVALFASRIISRMVGDVILTAEEVEGLLLNLLVSSGPPTGHTSFREWLRENSQTVGTEYHSELARHFS